MRSLEKKRRNLILLWVDLYNLMVPRATLISYPSANSNNLCLSSYLIKPSSLYFKKLSIISE